MLHVVSLSIDEAAKVENHSSGLVALAGKGGICVLEGGELFLVALALTFKLFGNVLLEDKRLKSIVALLLRAIETLGEASSVIFVLFDEGREAAIFTFVSFNPDLKFLCFLSKLLGESLKFEELRMLSGDVVDLCGERHIPAASSFQAHPQESCSS